MKRILKLPLLLSLCIVALAFSPKVEAGWSDLLSAGKDAISGLSVDPKAAKDGAITILKRNKKNIALILLYRSKEKNYAPEDQPKIRQYCDKFCNRLACGATPGSNTKVLNAMKVVATACFVTCNPSLTKACAAASKEKFPEWMAKLESARKAGKKKFEDLGKPAVPKVSELKSVLGGLSEEVKSVGITLPF